jgi:hypothetical protein
MTMAQYDIRPWHQVVVLRDDVRSGELALSEFAGDLDDVVKGNAKPTYQDPYQFFSRTYPTLALRDLARDIVQRLAGKNDKAIRQLALTYGGGKTHSLIALYHLVHNPSTLPDVPAIQEFRQYIGIEPPQTRIVVLPFDKFDVESGIDCVAPDQSHRTLRQPWSAIAYQIAGEVGLQTLHPDGLAEERQGVPAQNIWEKLIALSNTPILIH